MSSVGVGASLVSSVLVVWLVLLSIIVYGLARNTAKLDLAERAGSIPYHDLNAQGPSVGTEAPDHVADILAGVRTNWSTLVFVSPTCGICVEVVEDLVKSRTDEPAGLVVVVIGESGGKDSPGATPLLDALQPLRQWVLSGSAARTVMRALEVHALPYCVYCTDGRVRARGFLRSSGDIAEIQLEAERGKGVGAL